ncbi:hypothetical protein [Streptomyces anulatus]|uniref:Uncharacterized protein n=1 Tax=Streptomyces anulatus TaxID=1892 RepID=A0A7K3RNC4_STRAQ|nr:hypothetical protein [Streptomyces anulatus]NEC03427.1 hypothetical protein [Streptomyces anulatus]NED30727.1 hypothetical protein [Streptomyces anulatus]
MDAGLAGLIGALGGGLIGAAGASAAALIAFRGARYQVNRQTEATREQWLRQIRRDLYIGFITACRACFEHGRDTVNERSRQVDAAKVADWREAAKAVSVAYRALELEAPAPLVRLAGEVVKRNGPSFAVMEAAGAGADNTLSPEDLRQANLRNGEFYVLTAEFVEECRTSLHSEEPIHPQRWTPL